MTPASHIQGGARSPSARPLTDWRTTSSEASATSVVTMLAKATASTTPIRSPKRPINPA